MFQPLKLIDNVYVRCQFCFKMKIDAMCMCYPERDVWFNRIDWSWRGNLFHVLI